MLLEYYLLISDTHFKHFILKQFDSLWHVDDKSWHSLLEVRQNLEFQRPFICLEGKNTITILFIIGTNKHNVPILCYCVLGVAVWNKSRVQIDRRSQNVPLPYCAEFYWALCHTVKFLMLIVIKENRIIPKIVSN